MDRKLCIYLRCFLLFVGFPIQIYSLSYDSDTRRHQIYWDAKESRSIRDPKFTLQVEIGQFMDIICPYSNSRGPPPPVFDIYNVTEDGFVNCDPTVPGKRVIFTCDLPDRENKLTVKFQTISPSPFGFRFQPCQEYYLIAIKRDSILAPPRRRKYGCSRDSERLRIKVGCMHDKTKHTTTTTTATTTTTTNVRQDDPYVVVPSLESVPGKNPPGVSLELRGNGGNGSTRTAESNIVTLLFFALFSSLWLLNQSST